MGRRVEDQRILELRDRGKGIPGLVLLGDRWLRKGERLVWHEGWKKWIEIARMRLEWDGEGGELTEPLDGAMVVSFGWSFGATFEV